MNASEHRRAIAARLASSLVALLVAGTALGEPAPASDQAPAVLTPTAAVAASENEDVCFKAVRTAAADAERICSDRLAELRYDGAVSPTQRRALAGTLNNRAMARMSGGDLEGAGTDFEEAVSLQPDAWAIYLNRGNFELMRADPAAALEDYGRVARLAPAESDAARAARRNSALAWRALGDLAAAERSLAD